jgi:SAM-dependent methyltransferase
LSDEESGRAVIPGFFEGAGMPDHIWWEALWANPARVISDAGVMPGMSVIDLCSGNGWFTLHLSKIARAVTAIEIDRKLLDAARVRLTESGLTNCVFVEADAYDIAQIMHDRVDHVFLANAFHGAPDKPRLARVVHDVLRSGGLFAVVNWHPRPREETTVLGEPRGPATELRVTAEETIAAVQSSGLVLRRHVEIPPYHYAVVFERGRESSAHSHRNSARA